MIKVRYDPWMQLIAAVCGHSPALLTFGRLEYFLRLKIFFTLLNISSTGRSLVWSRHTFVRSNHGRSALPEPADSWDCDATSQYLYLQLHSRPFRDVNGAQDNILGSNYSEVFPYLCCWCYHSLLSTLWEQICWRRDWCFQSPEMKGRDYFSQLLVFQNCFYDPCCC